VVHQGRPPDLIERFNIPLDEYPRRCERQIAEWDALRDDLEAARARHRRSDEYGADIIRACETGEPFAFNGNVPNRCDGGLLIDNLPADCCVEVPCVASSDGIAPQPIGALPRQLAALIQTNVQRQGLTVEAGADGPARAGPPGGHARSAHRRRARRSTRSRALVDDLLAAHGNWDTAARAARGVRSS
jgi:alpha-galactosidase